MAKRRIFYRFDVYRVLKRRRFRHFIKSPTHAEHEQEQMSATGRCLKTTHMIEIRNVKMLIFWRDLLMLRNIFMSL